MTSIVGTLPYSISNGQLIDAVPVMGNFNYIVSQINSNAATTYFGIATGTSDALLVSIPNLNSIVDGTQINVRATYANSTINPTINVNSTSALTIVKSGQAPLQPGDIAFSGEMILRYNSSYQAWELVNPQASKVQWINITQTGADPTGVNDSTAAIQTAIDAASARGFVVYVPKGTYKIIPTTPVRWYNPMLGGIKLRSNLTIIADPGATFRIGDNVFSPYTNIIGMAMFITDQALHDISIGKLTLDMNVANNNPKITTTASITAANPAVVTLTSVGAIVPIGGNYLSNYSAIKFSGTVPAGLTAGVNYYAYNVSGMTCNLIDHPMNLSAISTLGGVAASNVPTTYLDYNLSLDGYPQCQIGVFGGSDLVACTVTITIASPCVIVNANAYLPPVGSSLALTTTGSLPTGLVVGTLYYVVGYSGVGFTISASLSGTPINTSGTQSGVHSIGYVAYIDDMLLENCRLINGPGTCSVLYNSTNKSNDVSGQRWTIRNNQFLNNGNYTLDNSVITGNGVNGIIIDSCVFATEFANALGNNVNGFGWGGRMAAEIHGKNALFTNNIIQNMYYIGWITPARDGGANDIIVANNVANYVSGGGILFQVGNSSNTNILCVNNAIHITDITNSAVGWGGCKPAFDFTDPATGSVGNVTIEGNTVTKDGVVVAASLVSIYATKPSTPGCDKIVIKGNTATNVSCGVQLQTDGTAGTKIGNIIISDNDFLDLNTSGIFGPGGSHPVCGVLINPRGASSVAGIYAQNNRTIDTRGGSAQTQYGIYVDSTGSTAATIGTFLDSGNVVEGTGVVRYGTGGGGSLSIGVSSGNVLSKDKLFTVTNSLTLTATDGSTLAVGAGGTLGTAAYTASSSYAPAAGSSSLVTVGTPITVTGTQPTLNLGPSTPVADQYAIVNFNCGNSANYNFQLLGADSIGIANGALTVWGSITAGGASEGSRIASFVSGATSAATQFRVHGLMVIPGGLLWSPTVPSVSGFGSGAAVVSNNGSVAFTINVGTSNSGSTGTITMPSGATHSWVLSIHNVTNPTHGLVGYTVSGATVTLTNYSRTTGLAANWTDGDVLAVIAFAY